MQLKNLFFNNKKEPQPVIKTESTSINFGSHKIQLQDNKDLLPIIKKYNNYDWVSYGVDNLHPEFLKQLYLSAPTNGTIIKRKAQMINTGFTFKEENIEEDRLLLVKSLLLQINKQLDSIILDSELYGAFALEILMSIDKKNIIRINHIPTDKIRSGEKINGLVDKYYYCNNWRDWRKEEIYSIDSFEFTDNESSRMLSYVPMQRISNDYYGDPSYSGGLNWAELERETGVFYGSLIKNGFNPSIMFKFPYLPTNITEQEEIVQGLKKQYGGSTNAGKSIVLFGQGAENEVKVDTIQTSGTDATFTVISDQITTKVLTSHEVTTPELFGISEPGRLGSGDFIAKTIAFNEFVIKPRQRKIEDEINTLFAFVGIDLGFRFNEFDVNIFNKISNANG